MTHTPDAQPRFPVSMRILHWLMVAMVLSMLFIGVAMVSSLADYHRLVSIHRPLGIMILIVVVIRFVNRKLSTLPPFPPTMSQQERRVAHASEILLYSLMFVLPLVGWGMLSAGGYPIVMYGPLHLPPILPPNPTLYWVLRKTHTILAYLLFLTFLAHFTAVLFHTLVIRDRLLDRMSVWTHSSGHGSTRNGGLGVSPHRTTEIDPRLYFSAEQNFLAWIRTCIALMGFGFILARFGVFLREIRWVHDYAGEQSFGASVWFGVGLVAIGIFALIAATVRHVQLIRILRDGRQDFDHPSRLAISIALVLACIGLITAIYLVIVSMNVPAATS